VEDKKQLWTSNECSSAGIKEAIILLANKSLEHESESSKSADSPKVRRSSDCLPMKTLAAYTHHQERLWDGGDNETLSSTD
jgi:hypothetical protein